MQIMNMTGYVLFWYLVEVKLTGPSPQNKILVPFRGHFQNIRRAPPSLLYGSISLNCKNIDHSGSRRKEGGKNKTMRFESASWLYVPGMLYSLDVSCLSIRVFFLLEKKKKKEKETWGRLLKEEG